jgi:hypothetical protein
MVPQIDVDWVSAGAVGPVRNQGSSGSATSIVASGALPRSVMEHSELFLRKLLKNVSEI